MIKVIETGIKDILIIEPTVYGDSRGYFMESFSARDFAAATGMDVKFVQDNESLSMKGVLRGLHFQKPPFAQAKLVRVVKGAVIDVAVDIRKGSPTYGQHIVAELTEQNHHQFFIPRGFAHGFYVKSEQALFQYKCDEYYHPEAEGAIAWDDPELAIDWQIDVTPRLSDKDLHHQRLAEIENPFVYTV